MAQTRKQKRVDEDNTTADAADENTLVSTVSQPSSETTHQPPPPNKRKSTSGSTQATKKPKGQEQPTDTSHEADGDKAPQRKPRGRKVVPERSPLPDRNRDQHPGLPDKSKPRRTSKEVAEANARKEELRAQLVKAEQAKLELLARMEMEEDMEAEAEEAAAMVNVLDDSDNESDKPAPKPKVTKATAKSAPRKGISSTLKDATDVSEVPRATNSKSGAAKPTAKAKRGSKAASETPMNGSTSSRGKGKKQRTVSSETVKSEANGPSEPTAEDGGIPEFVGTTWTSTFLPTLYNNLYCSEQPFQDFSKGEKIVAWIQSVVDLVHPGSKYQVKWNDDLCQTAISRVTEKCSQFAIKAMKIVDDFFSQPDYNGNAKKISAYAKYAMDINRPIIYKAPSPIGATIPGSEGFVAPEGVYESELIYSVLTTDYGNMKGALALTITALERAFTAYHTGQKVPQKMFSRDNYGLTVDDYMDNIKKLMQRRWDMILDGLGVLEMQPKEEIILTSLSENRRNLYVPSSP
ncbi:hypothetical protein BJV74DRAFT_793475 [Russula compacta]|nr:hypothetical protein BJV74DRAFT_793475 [Russula compacta]